MDAHHPVGRSQGHHRHRTVRQGLRPDALQDALHRHAAVVEGAELEVRQPLQRRSRQRALADNPDPARVDARLEHVRQDDAAHLHKVADRRRLAVRELKPIHSRQVRADEDARPVRIDRVHKRIGVLLPREDARDDARHHAGRLFRRLLAVHRRNVRHRQDGRTHRRRQRRGQKRQMIPPFHRP